MASHHTQLAMVTGLCHEEMVLLKQINNGQKVGWHKPRGQGTACVIWMGKDEACIRAKWPITVVLLSGLCSMNLSATRGISTSPWKELLNHYRVNSSIKVVLRPKK